MYKTSWTSNIMIDFDGVNIHIPPPPPKKVFIQSVKKLSALFQLFHGTEVP